MYRAADCLRAFQSFRVIVGDSSGKTRDLDRVLDVIEQPCRRRHPHRRAVAVASVRLDAVACQPLSEAAAVSRIRISASPLLHAPGNSSLYFFIRLTAFKPKKSISHSDRHDRIICRTALVAEQNKTLALCWIELERTACDISNYSSIHTNTSFTPLSLSPDTYWSSARQPKYSSLPLP